IDIGMVGVFAREQTNAPTPFVFVYELYRAVRFDVDLRLIGATVGNFYDRIRDIEDDLLFGLCCAGAGHNFLLSHATSSRWCGNLDRLTRLLGRAGLRDRSTRFHSTGWRAHM